MTTQELNQFIRDILALDLDNEAKAQRLVNISSDYGRQQMLDLVSNIREEWNSWPEGERDQNMQAFLDAQQG